MQRLLLTCALASMGMARAEAAAPSAVDVELLEFLGSIGSEEDGWQEYLEQRPVKVVGKSVAKPESPAPRAPTPQPAKPGAKQVKPK